MFPPELWVEIKFLTFSDKIEKIDDSVSKLFSLAINILDLTNIATALVKSTQKTSLHFNIS